MLGVNYFWYSISHNLYWTYLEYWYRSSFVGIKLVFTIFKIFIAINKLLFESFDRENDINHYNNENYLW